MGWRSTSKNTLSDWKTFGGMNMIKVLLFAHLQEKVGQESIEVEETGLSVKRLKTIMVEKYDLGEIEHVMVAVNEEYALDDDLVQSGDVVAFIPPVSGG